MTDFRPAIEVTYHGKPKRFIVRDAIDVVRFHVAKQTWNDPVALAHERADA